MNENLNLLMLLTFIAAGLVKGVTGMGLPTVAMGLLGSSVPPSTAAAILLIPSFVTNLWQLYVGQAVWPLLKRLWPMQLTIVLSTALGAGLLVWVNSAWSEFALGTALIGYAVYALCGPTFIIGEAAEKWLSPVMGILTGVVTGATGVFVMPAVPYLQSLGLAKDELVQALGLSFTISTLALALGLSLHGGLAVSQLGASTLAVIPALLGMWVGQAIRARISAKRFKQGFLLFLVVLGVQLASRPFV